MEQNDQCAIRFARSLAAVVLAGSAASFALAPTSAIAQGKHFGTWLNTDKKGKIELRECGNGGLCSEIVWLKDPLDEKGRPWRDILNPDPVKKRRAIMGLDVLEGLKKIGPNTWQGRIYDPEVGKLYYLKHIKIGSTKVEIRGCLPSGWPCRTKYWTKTKPVRAQQPPQVARTKPTPPPVQQRRVAQPRPAPAPVQRQAAAPPPPQPQVRPAPVQRQAPAPQRQAAVQPRPVQPAPPVTTGAIQRPVQPRPMTAAPATSASGYLVQVTAGRDQNEALQAFGKLQHRFPHILGGYLPNVQRADLGDKGIWYRVRVGPLGARTTAVDFCNKLKQAGGDCLIRRQ